MLVVQNHNDGFHHGWSERNSFIQPHWRNCTAQNGPGRSSLTLVQINPTRVYQKRTVACWACQNMFLLDLLTIPLISRSWNGGSVLPVSLWKPFPLGCGPSDILVHREYHRTLKHNVFQKQKDEENGEIKKTGLFRPFLLLLSTAASDFQWADLTLLRADRQLLWCPDGWTSAILAAPPLPSPTTLSVCFCDTAPLHEFFHRVALSPQVPRAPSLPSCPPLSQGWPGFPIPVNILCPLRRELLNRWCSSFGLMCSIISCSYLPYWVCSHCDYAYTYSITQSIQCPPCYGVPTRLPMQS